MKDLIIAAQLYTVRDLLNGKGPDEVHKVLKQIKEIGYPSVQISGVGDITKEVATMYRDICSELELEICATHTSIEYLKANFDWVVEYHKMWNCKFIGIGAMPYEMRNYDGCVKFIDDMNKYGKMLKEKGLVLIYHNHRFEFEKYSGKNMMDIMFDTYNKTVKFELDTYWIQAGGSDPVEWIYKTDGRMSVVHFKDYRVVSDEPQFAEIGNGNLAWSKIIKACKDTGVKYLAVEQDCFTDDAINSLKVSYDYLSKML